MVDIKAAFDTHARRISCLLVKLVSDPQLREDIFQTVWLQYAERGRDESPDQAGAILTTIARRRVYDHYRRNPRLVQYLSGILLTSWEGELDSDQRAVEAERKLILREIVEKLPDPLRREAGLKWLQGLTVAQIAAKVGTAEGTVKSRIRRARRLVEERLEDQSAFRSLFAAGDDSDDAT